MIGANPVSAADPANPINVGAPMFVAKMEPAIWGEEQTLKNLKYRSENPAWEYSHTGSHVMDFPAKKKPPALSLSARIVAWK